MANPIGSSEWILCTHGRGYACPGGVRDPIRSHFPVNSVGVVQATSDPEVCVYLPGQEKEFFVARTETASVDVQATGKGYTHMICNVCFVLKTEAEFQINQTDARGNKTRRPSCQKCRQGIDRRDMSARQYREAKRQRPPVGSLWRCPICRKMGSVGVNVKVVIDHDHHAGRKRGFLCDSCNTGLGRFKNGKDFLHNALAYLEESEGG